MFKKGLKKLDVTLTKEGCLLVATQDVPEFERIQAIILKAQKDNEQPKSNDKKHIFTILERKNKEIADLTDKVNSLTLHINIIEEKVLSLRAERLGK